MIPKVIHYCWFGGKEEPKSVKKCIQSWQKYCPDYEIRRWDESNFDVNVNDYCREAYQSKKWAFISDYARLKIVYENGGIYMDTDVELLKSLDSVLDNEFFLAMEKDRDPLTGEEYVQIATGLGFGAVKGNEMIRRMAEKYNHLHFLVDGKMNVAPCAVYSTQVLEPFGYQRENRLQTLEKGTIYPADYFCPKEYRSKVTNFSQNTIAIHHFAMTWISPYEKHKIRFINFIKRILIKSGLYRVTNKKKSVAESEIHEE